MKCLRLAILIGVFFNNDCLFSEENILSGHPRESYSDVKNIDEMEAALRDSLASIERHSFSRGWWVWDRLRCRYVDGGRKDSSALRVLRAVFRGLLLDRHKKLEEKGEGDLLYIFYTSLTGDRKESTLNVNGRKVFRDVHGGGYHGGWGGAARMRIYEELSSQKMLSAEEEVRFEEIVKQSLEPRFIDFKKKAQSANNHSFGNAGGIALALDLFPDAPQADEARAWIDRIWKNLSEFGDWTEWNYYPYGPIFLHGLIDIAEITGRIDTEKELINAVGNRCLGFIHGGGVRGNPNCGSVVRDDLELVYKDPWNYGYYDVETSARDGHFWYRLAKHYKNPYYLWAAEQVSLGGRPLNGKVSKEYDSAYERRFAWFIERDIKPKIPEGGAKIGLLSSLKNKIPERLYLNRDRKAGSAFAAFFLYPEKDEHLDNVSGHLYEYSVSGSKYLHTSGKYNNVYSGKDLRGGGTGEESLDLLLVMHNRHQFPLHPDRKGDDRDFMRRGSIKHDDAFVIAENNKFGDSYGRFAFDNYYGEGSRWERRVVLTREGFFIVLDRYRGGEILREDYLAGPVWHVGFDEAVKEGGQSKNWFDFPPLDNAWWKKKKSRALLISHPHSKAKYGLIKQKNSQDTSPNVTLYSYRPVSSLQDEYFLNLFIPYDLPVDSSSILKQTKTHLDSMGNAKIDLGHAGIEILIDESWSVVR
ncbi:MAG: hypothetical protein CMO49_01665 [Verrucomicrobiales bacterium]|nr:hypothetical protein [Verrucomicrobiales bacterium]